jgi:hypothetical protein
MRAVELVCGRREKEGCQRFGRYASFCREIKLVEVLTVGVELIAVVLVCERQEKEKAISIYVGEGRGGTSSAKEQ